MLFGDKPMVPLKPYQCPICLSGRVAAHETACHACQAVFKLVDEQTPDVSHSKPRAAAGTAAE
jgi:hypothetical protein